MSGSIGPITDVVARAAVTALNGVADRQSVVADNIANASTPGYLAREVSFEDALGAAMDAGRAPETAAATTGLADTPVKADGNSVDVARETMLLGETEVQYQSLVQVFNFRNSIIRDGLSR